MTCGPSPAATSSARGRQSPYTFVNVPAKRLLAPLTVFSTFMWMVRSFLKSSFAVPAPKLLSKNSSEKTNDSDKSI